MQSYIQSLKTKTTRQLCEVAGGRDVDFPENHVLFVQRDTYGGKGYPHVLIPKTEEAILSFVIHHHWAAHHAIHKDRGYTLRIYKHFPKDLIVEIEHSGRWVKGYIKYGVPEGMKIPHLQYITEADNKLFEGWRLENIRGREVGNQWDHDVRIWVKD